jgi:hypothetical protein
MNADEPRTILCISSYFKGGRFLQRCRLEGCRVFLLTVESLRDAAWPRDQLDDVFLMPSLGDRRAVINGIAYLMRTRKIDLVVALDDYDVELASLLREHFRLPGLGDSATRHFRDKLAMRLRAREKGIAVPDFVPVFRYDDVRRFLATVPAPWLIKPRSEASSIGIKKCHHADEVWRHLDVLGDEQSYHLIERFIAADLYHVDSLAVDSRIIFSEVGQYHRPLLEVYHGGGIFASRTVPRDRPDATALRRLNEQVMTAFGMIRGCSHTEFLRGHEDGVFYFLETSCRVGGAGIAEMVEAATGLNLWEEWAAIEVGAGQRPYALPSLRHEHGGVIVSLARQEQPDTSPFDDPEVWFRMDQKHHIGLVLRSTSSERIEELLTRYTERIARDYHKALPPTDRATA